METTLETFTASVDTMMSGGYEYGPDIEDWIHEKVENLSREVQESCMILLQNKGYKKEADYIKTTYLS